MEDKQKPTNAAHITAPTAMAELEIMKLENAKSVAVKNPNVRNIALLLIVVVGVTLLSQIATYAILQSFGNTQTDFLSLFVNSNGAIGIAALSAQVIAVFVLLFTRSTSHAKKAVVVAGAGFAITAINHAIGFQIGPSVITDAAALVVNFLILRKIFEAYIDL